MIHAREGEVEQRIADIRARLDAATPGPWQRFDVTDSGLLPDVVDANFNHLARVWGHNDETPSASRHNGEFIAHSPDDVRFLLDALAASQSRAEAVEAEMQSWRTLATHCAAYLKMADAARSAGATATFCDAGERDAMSTDRSENGT